MHIFRVAPRPASENSGSFAERVKSLRSGPFTASGVKVLQVNMGYQCNMACAHCHLAAGPGRSEAMDGRTVDAVLRALMESPIETLDITGGAPELNPDFRRLVTKAREAGKRVIVRTNLTIMSEKGMEDLPEFYRDRNVELIASLPCYLEDNVNRLRGNGSFTRSIEAMVRLNRLGYGMPDNRFLGLVYNPGGPFLPPNQCALESDYKKELKARYGVSFSRLYAFTNMPIGRFRDSLAKRGELEKYTALLASAFNPATLDQVMCRSLVSVGWDGRLYDCDFNQALNAEVLSRNSRTIFDCSYEALSRRPIALGDHCYGCTAGQGST